MHMQRTQKNIVQLMVGLAFIFPLLFDIFVVPLFRLPMRLVAILKDTPFLLSGEFVMSMSVLLFIVGSGLCYFAMEKWIL